ncbi:MAG TPA: flagellar biosynthetic protein FliO [bacterium]|nr:flagellar biosynthetic protein FliO [bacterium]
MRWRLTILFLLAGLLAAATVWAAEPVMLKSMNFIENVAALPDQPCAFIVQAQNRAGYDSAKVYRKGDEVHVNLYNTYVHPPVRIFKKLDNACAKQVAVHQINKQFVKMIITLTPGYDGTKAPSFTETASGLEVYVGDKPTPVAAPGEAAVGQLPAPIPEEARIDLAALLNPEANADKQEAKTEDAAPTATAAPLAGGGGVDWSDAIVKVIVALSVTLALVFILFGLAKRFRLPARIGGGKQGLIRVVQTAMIDLKHRIAVVDVAGELIVVALAGNEMKMLTKIESPEARERLLGTIPVEPAPKSEPAFVAAPNTSFAEEVAAPEPENVEPVAAAENFDRHLQNYVRHNPSEHTVVEHRTLRSISERVKELKRL